MGDQHTTEPALRWSEQEAARIILAGTLAEPAPITKMEKAGFARVEALGEQVTLDKGRLRLYPLFTQEFLDWLFDQFGGESPIYTVHLQGMKPKEVPAT